jgi:uncharacterized membrane-anchored protein YhcB (DUF1043 family)
MGWIIGIICLLIGIYLGMVLITHFSLRSKLKSKRSVFYSREKTASETYYDRKDKSDLTE